MAAAHVYVRVQVHGTNADIQRIHEAAESLRQSVESAGGEWVGGASCEFDAPPNTSPETPSEPPSETTSVQEHEANADPIPPDDTIAGP